MPPSTQVPVASSVLQWARKRAGKSVSDLTRKFPKYADWEAGRAHPTIRQVESFSRLTHTPLGYLFLPEPPVEQLPIADFRTVSGEEPRRPSLELLDTVFAMLRRQEFAHDLLVDAEADPVDFVGSYSRDAGVLALVSAMRTRLNLQPAWARSHESWEKALAFLREKIEQAGVFVMTNGVVGNNTHRPLRVEEFRGFSLVDRWAPLIFLNNADAKSAQMFTLLHELAHVWLGESGVSGEGEFLPASTENITERFCDQVAAEFLVPETELRNDWESSRDPDENIDRFSRYFKVSPLVVARRALDLGLVAREWFRKFYLSVMVRRTRPSGGGDFYKTAGVRLGDRFPRLIFGAVRSGEVAYTTAYDLTDLRGESFSTFCNQKGY